MLEIRCRHLRAVSGSFKPSISFGSCSVSQTQVRGTRQWSTISALSSIYVSLPRLLGGCTGHLVYRITAPRWNRLAYMCWISWVAILDQANNPYVLFGGG